MSDEPSLVQLFASESPLLDVVFVHGLTGDAYETWQCSSDKTFWPEWLKDDVKHCSAYSLGFPAGLIEKWAKKEMDMFELAGNVLERFAGLGIGKRPIAFVTHSLGGILLKIILRKSNEADDEDWTLVSLSTRLVVFLSTPHTGSALAEIGNKLPGVSKHVALLANETGFLEDLNLQYRNFANNREDLVTKVYYEKYRTFKASLVVSRESADPGVAGATLVAVATDHMGVCKPQGKDDVVYLGIKRHLTKLRESLVLAAGSGANGIYTDDYSEKSQSDRRDLLEKLIDSGREAEYGYANEAQNGFARQFAKTGLFTAAREDHDVLLSEVETRFVTHVYHPLICADGSDEQIRDALQEKVIDALAEKTFGQTRFSSKSIVSALYFLTEQCHIRWDPET